ncbi:MAG: DNA internalization-related competence protein ComEC/Rec2 [Nitrospira sp.]|jgi:competence protein ComEC|nr:MAG: DNA internalization-related competence protein ComEC/Rec2 [Nitrospira sp.]
MLPSLTITFVFGLVLGSYLAYFPLGVAFLLTVVCGILTLLELRAVLSSRQALSLLACLLAGCLYWVLFAWFTPHVPVPETTGALPARVDGTIVEAVRHAPERLTAIVQVTAIDEPAQMLPFHLRLTWRDPDRDLHRGMRISTGMHVHPPLGTLNPRGFDYAAYLDAQGVDAVGSVSGAGAVQVLEPEPGLTVHGFASMIENWRALVRSAAQSLAQPSRGLFLSLTIGEQGYLAPEVREWFMTTGTVHILSVSGSHLGLIALLSFALIRRTCLLLPSLLLLSLSRWLTASRLAALATLGPVAAYTLLAGAETATIRSSIMIVVGLWALWLGSPHYMLHALAAAAGLTLLVHPPALYDISFQLSYVSVLVLALAIQPEAQRDGSPEPQSSAAKRALYWLRESVRVTALVTLATLPLVAFYFNQVSWLGLFANLLVVPFVGFILLPLDLVSAAWVIATHSHALPGSGLIDVLGEALISAIHLLAGLPGAEWFVAAPSLPMMLLFYLLGWGLLAGRSAHAAPLVRGAMVMGILCIVTWWLWSPRPFSRDGQVRVTFLDVGQGDSAVIELPTGAVVLIDGGATYERFDMGRGVVAPFLWNRGIRRVNHVIATHPQLDHAGGLAWILAHFSIENFWTNGVTRREEFWRKIEAVLAQQPLQPKVAAEGQLIAAAGACRMAVLNPPLRHEPSSGRKSESLNNLSVVTELTCGDRRMLFTGDIEREALARLTRSGILGHITLLKVPHHGAKSSLEPTWLSTITPNLAVLSAGRRNPYGHPAPEVLAAYRAAGVEVLRTDRDGAVWVDLDLRQQNLSVHTTSEWILQSALSSSNIRSAELENLTRLWRRWNWR